MIKFCIKLLYRSTDPGDYSSNRNDPIKRKLMEDKVDDLLKKSIIGHSNTEHGTLNIFVTKKHGKFGFSWTAVGLTKYTRRIATVEYT